MPTHLTCPAHSSRTPCASITSLSSSRRRQRHTRCEAGSQSKGTRVLESARPPGGHLPQGKAVRGSLISVRKGQQMLARIRKAMKDKEEGFTLIELLVVMIIIGILAAIAIPVFLSQRQKGYDASVKSDLRTIANELESYNTDAQAYPAITGGVVSTAGVSTIGTDATTVRTSSNNTFTYVLSTAGVSAAGAAYCLTGS